ncbi:DNA methyltransferase [Sulfitobacter sp. F26169L]|uniref:DNA methyltransferase n=1 Tax=Sulfitobacter sp. F26169L TaxID=2996015 RepID=UPI002260A307|nr:DNA methyltransferase [Sulfitobacter sp. F26169L]MCX7568071.1 DNA methyltransferase [Sulfitobacter sp. F26169L]
MKDDSYPQRLSLDKPPGYKQKTAPAMPFPQTSTSDTYPPLANLLFSAEKTLPVPAKHICTLDFLTDIREFSGLGTITTTFIENDIPYYLGKFFKSGGARLHALHEFSYRASFNPHLPEFLIERLSSAGDIVHDPFAGSGTTLIEAARLGRIACGSDINPMAEAIIAPRIGPEITPEGIIHALETVDWSAGHRHSLGLPSEFFNAKTLQKLSALQVWSQGRAPFNDADADPVARWIRMVVLSRLTGHSSGFMSGYTLPPNKATTSASQRRINEERGENPPERDVKRNIIRKTRSLLRDGSIPYDCRHRIGVGDASDTPWIEDASVNLVVTSPPFCTEVDYAFEHWLRLKYFGIDPKSIAFSHIASLKAWTAMIRNMLMEMMRVVKPGGYIALEVGEIKKGTVKLERAVWEAAEGLPCRRLGVIIHDAEFTKTSHIFDVTKNQRGTNTNRIVIMQRL